ncbi:MAG: hypothetical protein MUE51_11215 [Thermoleophilia bacterium]|jgi:virginiamycin B lyase|nr:hypothetical protein [Thermoleophilia bacterium]
MRPLAGAVALAALAVVPAGALGAPALAGDFPLTGKPGQMATGPDGNVWFALSDSSAAKEFGRIAPDGTVTEYDTVDGGSPVGITTGPDGGIWMTATGKVYRANPGDGSTQAFPIPTLMDARGITAGPDGNLWTGSGDTVYKISTSGTVVTTYTVAGMGARGIAAGGDGALWIADFGSGRIVRVTTGGATMPVTVGGGPQEVAAGPQGQMGFANPNSVFGRMAYDGTFQTTQMPATDPFGIVFGNDGAYWTAQFATGTLGRVTPAGAYTQLGLPAGSGPRYLAKGAGDTLWVGLETAKRIARITGVSAPPAAPPPPPPTPATPATPGTPIPARLSDLRARRVGATRVRVDLRLSADVRVRVQAFRTVRSGAKTRLAGVGRPLVRTLTAGRRTLALIVPGRAGALRVRVQVVGGVRATVPVAPARRAR